MSVHKNFRFPVFSSLETLIEDHRLTGWPMKYYPAGTYDGAKAIHWGEGLIQSDGFIYEWEVKGIHKYSIDKGLFPTQDIAFLIWRYVALVFVGRTVLMMRRVHS